MGLSELPADILLLVASFLDVNTLVSFSQAFRSIYSLSQSSVSWWQHDLAVAYLPSIKPASSYTLQELRSAALCAHRAWSKFSQSASPFNIDAHLVEKLNANREAALSYIDRIQTEFIRFKPHYAHKPPTWKIITLRPSFTSFFDTFENLVFTSDGSFRQENRRPRGQNRYHD
ncbi:hypothetical protein CPB86DRAFT_821147 [Serendipita vermifera]|nr:hypothetical protein CPB86DRAFT_821147 [Serendipita vermifera]